MPFWRRPLSRYRILLNIEGTLAPLPPAALSSRAHQLFAGLKASNIRARCLPGSSSFRGRHSRARPRRRIRALHLRFQPLPCLRLLAVTTVGLVSKCELDTSKGASHEQVHRAHGGPFPSRVLRPGLTLLLLLGQKPTEDQRTRQIHRHPACSWAPMQMAPGGVK